MASAMISVSSSPTLPLGAATNTHRRRSCRSPIRGLGRSRPAGCALSFATATVQSQMSHDTLGLASEVMVKRRDSDILDDDEQPEDHGRPDAKRARLREEHSNGPSRRTHRFSNTHRRTRSQPASRLPAVKASSVGPVLVTGDHHTPMAVDFLNDDAMDLDAWTVPPPCGLAYVPPDSPPTDFMGLMNIRRLAPALSRAPSSKLAQPASAPSAHWVATMMLDRHARGRGIRRYPPRARSSSLPSPLKTLALD